MENSYFSEDHGINQIKVNKSKKRSVSIPTFIISLIMVACLVVLLFLKRDDIIWFFWGEQIEEEIEINQWLSIWDEVAFSGSIRADWDMENYTHSYISDEYWVIWLRSKSLILNDYSDNIYFEWVVEKFSHEIPIVNVTNIYNLDENEQEFTGENIETWENLETNTKYLPKLWLYFDENFFEKYSLVNEWDGSTLKIKDLETNIIYTINYFKCNTSNNSENCNYLNNLYSQSSSKKFVDKYWVSYYKDPEVNSRFFSNDSLFGFKLNDTDEAFVKDISTLLTVVNKNFAEKNVLPKVKSLCTINHSSIENINKSEFTYKDSNFFYDIEWTNMNNKMITCELKINPTLQSFAQIESIEITDNEETANNDEKWDNEIIETWSTTEPENKEQQAYIWDTDVEQFPINLDKKLTFTSSRWHSFIFPSSNLAYQWVNVSEDFGQVWVNCFSAMNVVKYADKELVESQGNVVIYECKVKNTFDDSDKTLIYKKVWDKDFVIKINDPARVNFANNIEIIA